MQEINERFKCIGRGKTVNTSAYCEYNQCAEEKTRFCCHKKNDAAYFANENGLVPLKKACGVVSIPIYEAKALLKGDQKCENCHTACGKGGTEVHFINKKIDYISKIRQNI